MVTLYAGGQYHLYTFKKYQDIRIVFAPEKQIAFFGGDPDNFEYPRYDLDVAFFRVYENDQPVKPPHYLNWSPAGCKEGELTFVSGHPGRTSRQNTVAELKYLRDVGYPYVLQRLNRLEVLLQAWGGRSESNMQRAEETLFSIQNSRKARIGGLAGLLDPSVLARKEADEKRLRDFIVSHTDTELRGVDKTFDVIARANKVRAEMAVPYALIEQGGAFNSDLFGIARTLARAADELPKPNGERLPEFGEARLNSLKFRLFSDEPIYDDFEIIKLADSLTFFATSMGPDSEIAKQVLAGKSPRERAFELVSGTKVRDVEVRKKLFEGGKAAVDAAKDPMIELARLIDPASRDIRKKYEAEVDEPRRQSYAALAKARYLMDGTKVYPDATFTLRLAFGQVKGYTEDGKPMPAFTTMAGLYARSKDQGNKGPFELPKRWEERKSKLDPNTPFNFVSTADIIGGNSGSPVINQKGEVVGLIFDGNIQSLVLDIIYDEKEARAVSVDSRAIVEALRKVYDASDLADELTRKQ